MAHEGPYVEAQQSHVRTCLDQTRTWDETFPTFGGEYHTR